MRVMERTGLQWARNISVAGLALLAGAAQAVPAVAPGISPETVAPVLKLDLERPRAAYVPGHAGDWAELQRFYRARDFRPVWLGNPAAGIAVSALEHAGADGLDPARYHGPSLAARQRLGSNGAAASYDMALTDGLLRYAHDLRRGQIADPAKVDDMVGIIRPGFDPVFSLSVALRNGGLRHWLTGLPPAHPQYARLKQALARYRAIVAKGGWPKVPVVRKIRLEPGNPELVALRARLAAVDPVLARAAADDMTALETAVKRFQSENGLEVDGVVGRKTIAALNISAAERVAQIEANMERWRWLPHKFPKRYVAVNTADATLKAVDDGKVVLTSRVIVGKVKTPSPIFNAKAEALTINPYWNVPASITRKEILPKLRRNPAYLSRHHMEFVGRRIRQLPGAYNALGYIKVEMPNPFSTYLHDTASRRLFARDERHLSHGCIRVQKIQPLASWLLTGSTEKGLERIRMAIGTGKTEKIPLDKKVPVFVLYWTAVPAADGQLEFRPDVYGRDKRLIAALAGRPKTDAAELGVKGDTDCAM